MSWHPWVIPRTVAQNINNQMTMGINECMAPHNLTEHEKRKIFREEKAYQRSLERRGLGGNYIPEHKLHVGISVENRSAEEDWKARRHTIPKGPKTLNQAILGDPLIGRSSLEKQKQE